MNKSQKSKAKTLRRKTGLTTDVLDLEGRIVDKIELPKEIFATPANDKLLAQAIRVYLARQRQGTASTKTRGEVTGSTRKIYRQKGTGRARHGAITAPIFVGGGIVFGPKPRSFSLKLPPKMRTQALRSALAGKFKDHDLLVVSGLSTLKAKTQEITRTLKNLKLEMADSKLKTKTLLVLPEHEEHLIRACRNIQNLTLTPTNLLNSYLILANQKIIFTHEAIKSLWKQPAS